MLWSMVECVCGYTYSSSGSCLNWFSGSHSQEWWLSVTTADYYHLIREPRWLAVFRPDIELQSSSLHSHWSPAPLPSHFLNIHGRVWRPDLYFCAYWLRVVVFTMKLWLSEQMLNTFSTPVPYHASVFAVRSGVSIWCSQWCLSNTMLSLTRQD